MRCTNNTTPDDTCGKNGKVMIGFYVVDHKILSQRYPKCDNSEKQAARLKMLMGMSYRRAANVVKNKHNDKLIHLDCSDGPYLTWATWMILRENGWVMRLDFRLELASLVLEH